LHENKQNVEYAASRKECSSCPLKSQCTKSKTSRSLQRHVRQEELNGMFADAQTRQAKRNIKTRQHLMERSFARSYRFGFDRARWRGLWKVNIQEYLVSTIQNIQTLIWNVTKPKTKALALHCVHEVGKGFTAVLSSATSLLSLSFIQMGQDSVRNLFSNFLRHFPAIEFCTDCYCE
jgi:hypothetical protein